MANPPLNPGVPSQREAIAVRGGDGQILVSRAWFYFFQVLLNRTVPVGSVLSFAGGILPSGYLSTDGSAVSRVTFSNLFASIGTAFGAGDGASTFNLPNIAPVAGVQSMIKT